MKRMIVLALALAACGGAQSIDLPMDKTIEFTVTTQEGQETPVDCYGLMWMAKLRAYASCQYTPPVGTPQGPFGKFDTFEASIEYLPQADEVWLHFYTAPEDAPHYPVSQGMPMAIALKPGGRGWIGVAVYYPRDAVIGYMDRAVEAWVQ
jgi:hypothetical protein